MTRRRLASAAPFAAPVAALLVLAVAAPGCKKSGESAAPTSGADEDEGGSAGGGGGGEGDEGGGEEFLTASGFEEFVQGKGGEVSECFSEASEKTPGLGGKLILDFTIAGDGSVESTAVGEGSTLTDATFVGCVQKKAAGWRLPKTRDGEAMTLSFPFALSGG